MSSSFMLMQERFVPAFCACRVVLQIRGLVAKCEIQDDERAGVLPLRLGQELLQEQGGCRQNYNGRYCYLLVKTRDKDIRKPSSPDPPFTADDSVVAIFTRSACF